MLPEFGRRTPALPLISSLFFLCRRRSTATTPTTLYQSDTPGWTSTNDIIRRHPRLHHMERCRSTRDLQLTLSYTIVSGLFRNPFVASRVIHRCTADPQPDITLAAAVFNQMEQPNLFSWNTMIGAFAKSADRSLHAFLVYVKMLDRGLIPDRYCLPFLLKACRSSSDLRLGRLVHGHALVLGLFPDNFVQTELLVMYLKCGSLVIARQLFDQITHRDVVSWTALISGFVDRGCNEEALEMLNDMRGEGSIVTPNVATMVSALSACANLGSLVHSRSLHAYLEKVGLQGEVFIGNSMVDAYAKCGSIWCAGRVFDCMRKRDLHSWTAMIMGLASYGFGIEALNMFSQMEHRGVFPDSVTFVALLSACSHAGLVDEALRIFDSMERVYQTTPQLKHYGCMVDLFSRAGLLTRAYDIILTMPMEPNLAILGSLLSSCRIHNNKELGEVVAKKIQSVCDYQGGSHVLLSNIYANGHLWQEVVSIREITKGDDRKPPGQSWIEVDGIFHEFIVEDKSHPFATEMRLALDGLGKLMECL